MLLLVSNFVRLQIKQNLLVMHQLVALLLLRHTYVYVLRSTKKKPSRASSFLSPLTNFGNDFMVSMKAENDSTRLNFE